MEKEPFDSAEPIKPTEPLLPPAALGRFFKHYLSTLKENPHVVIDSWNLDELVDRAEGVARRAILRNNEMSKIIESPDYIEQKKTARCSSGKLCYWIGNLY